MNDRLRQPRKCSGFTPTRQFAHKPKVRRNAARVQSLQIDQALQLSPWGHIESVKHKVDESRVNWKGLLYVQEESGVYDPTPRLRKRGSR